METIEVLKKYKTSKIIKLINKGKLNIEEFLIHAIGYKNILDNYVINLEYKNKFDCDFLEAAILSGNIEIIEKLKHLGVDINKKYKYGRKNINAMIFIQDVDTFKYFENYFDKKEIKPCLDIIIKSTFTNYNVELLDYIVKNYL